MNRESNTPSPLTLLLRALRLFLSARVHFVRKSPDEQIHVSGERFEPFRKVMVDAPTGPTARPAAIVTVRFRFKNLSVPANRVLSLIPIPLIVAQPGFRSKTWYLGQQSEELLGLYEFDTLEDAEKYWESLPIRMMRRRALSGSLSHDVRPIDAPHIEGISSERVSQHDG